MPTVLADHPSDTYGQRPREAAPDRHPPLSAAARWSIWASTRPGGCGKHYGEQYYRKFWGQLIHRLGLRHAQGVQKRFVVHTDRQQYQADDEAILTVGAYDANFVALTENKLPGNKLTAELVLPAASSRQTGDTREIPVPQSRAGGIFEARFPVYAEGEYRIRVRDPIAKDFTEATFRVTALSAERECTGPQRGPATVDRRRNRRQELRPDHRGPASGPDPRADQGRDRGAGGPLVEHEVHVLLRGAIDVQRMAGPKVGTPAMTMLSKLHRRLAHLRRRRRLIRWGTGYSAPLTALLWLLVALFLADWLLHMDVWAQIVGMAVAGLCLIWIFRRQTLPWLGDGETEVNMALFVQQQHHIDTDLVAALEFERPEAPTWGSVQLEEQVIQQTAELTRDMDVTEGLKKDRLRRRMTTLLITAAVVALAVVRFPDYTWVFLNRLLLGRAHYPTRTVISALEVNGHAIDLNAWQKPSLSGSYGRPIRFKVLAVGRIPEEGRVAVRIVSGGLESAVKLEKLKAPAGVAVDAGVPPTSAQGKPVASAPSPLPSPGGRGGTGTAEDKQVAFAGELPRLLETINFQVFLGDAWTDPAEVRVVPLPLVNVSLLVTPPSYAKNDPTVASGTTGLRRIYVIEGSRVNMRIISDKRLREATVTIGGVAFPMSRDPSPARTTGRTTGGSIPGSPRCCRCRGCSGRRSLRRWNRWSTRSSIRSR